MQSVPRLLLIWFIFRTLLAWLRMVLVSGTWALPSAYIKGKAGTDAEHLGPCPFSSQHGCLPSSPTHCTPWLQPSTAGIWVTRGSWESRAGQVPWGSSDLGESEFDKEVEAPRLKLAFPLKVAQTQATEVCSGTQHFSSNEGFNFLFLLSRVRYITAKQSFSSAWGNQGYCPVWVQFQPRTRMHRGLVSLGLIMEGTLLEFLFLKA